MISNKTRSIYIIAAAVCWLALSCYVLLQGDPHSFYVTGGAGFVLIAVITGKRIITAKGLVRRFYASQFLVWIGAVIIAVDGYFLAGSNGLQVLVLVFSLLLMYSGILLMLNYWRKLGGSQSKPG